MADHFCSNCGRLIPDGARFCKVCGGSAEPSKLRRSGNLNVPEKAPVVLLQSEARKAPAEAKPIEPQPVEAKPIEPQPVEPQPVEAQPVEVKPVEVKPIEVQPVEAKPIEPQPVEPQPVRRVCAVCGTPVSGEKGDSGFSEALPDSLLCRGCASSLRTMQRHAKDGNRAFEKEIHTFCDSIRQDGMTKDEENRLRRHLNRLIDVYEAAPAEQPAPAVAANAPVFCRYCGKPVEAGSTFCIHCGRSLNDASSAEEPAEDLFGDERPLTSRARSASGAAAKTVRKPAKKAANAKMLIAILVAVVLVVTAAVFGVLALCGCFGKSSDDEDSPSVEELTEKLVGVWETEYTIDPASGEQYEAGAGGEAHRLTFFADGTLYFQGGSNATGEWSGNSFFDGAYRIHDQKTLNLFIPGYNMALEQMMLNTEWSWSLKNGTLRLDPVSGASDAYGFIYRRVGDAPQRKTAIASTSTENDSFLWGTWEAQERYPEALLGKTGESVVDLTFGEYMVTTNLFGGEDDFYYHTFWIGYESKTGVMISFSELSPEDAELARQVGLTRNLWEEDGKTRLCITGYYDADSGKLWMILGNYDGDSDMGLGFRKTVSLDIGY